MSQSQGVSRLKELLFDSESQALADLARRIDNLAQTTAAERKAILAEVERLSQSEERERVAILGQVKALFDRVGTAERLEKSVAGVIDGALRQAEVERHDDLADAVSPLVVRTVKTEIRNSRDELVEALYPMTGRIVKAYVASAMKDLMEEVNRRLERNPVMLRFAALVTGRSAAELALAETQRTEVEELYLIRRGTGELVGRWPDSLPGANRDQVISGVLSALTEFASEAFSDDGRQLRQIDLGPSQVYLRLSPLYLMAVRCKGSQHAAIEGLIDDEFLSGLERHAALAAAHPPGAIPRIANDALLTGIGRSLATRIAEKEAELAPPRVGTAVLKTAAVLIVLPLLGWLAWSSYVDYETRRVRDIATAVIGANADLKGYPTSLTVAPRGGALTISGLAPQPAAKEKVIAELRSALPGRDVEDQLVVVPSGLEKAEPLVRAARKELGDQIERNWAQAASQLAAEREGRERALATLRAEAKARDDGIAALSDRLSALAARPIPVIEPPTPRERLAAWTRTNAIFFGNGADYRDPQQAEQLVDELAGLMKASDAVVRVVGYTDETGSSTRNIALSQSRADTVLAALVARGVPPSRLVPVGRQNTIGIAATKGAQSANRRVEFELGFVGEPGP